MSHNCHTKVIYLFQIRLSRNLATGGTIYDRSKKFSTQLQQANEFLDGNLRFVWGIDYFMTMPDTRGTILRDNNGNDRRDNDGDGEAGSPNTFGDQNEPQIPFDIHRLKRSRKNVTTLCRMFQVNRFTDRFQAF